MKYCYSCGEILKPGADVCLNCGKQVRSKNVMTQSSNADSKAVLGLVLAIVSFFLPIPVAALSMSIIATYLGNDAKKSPDLNKEGLANAAFIIGVISIIFNVVYWLIMLSAF